MGTDFQISIRVGEVGVEGIAHLHKVSEVTTESSKRIHTQGQLLGSKYSKTNLRERERERVASGYLTTHHHHLPKAPRAPTKYSKASCRGEHL
jgi:hypothetical protein